MRPTATACYASRWRGAKRPNHARSASPEPHFFTKEDAMNQSNPMSQVSPPGPNDPASQTQQPSPYGSYGGTPDDAFSQGGEISSTEQRGQQPRTEPVTTILPPVDIFEDEAGFTLIADLPGVSKDQLV